MKKKHKDELQGKLAKLMPELRKLLDKEGLEDFSIKNLTMMHNENIMGCPDPNDEPCMVPTPTGYKTICVPKGSCV